MITDDVTAPFKSYASQKRCDCNLCIKAQNNKPIKQPQISYCSAIDLPNETAYKFICDQIVNSPISTKLTFNIIDTFFFHNEGNKKLLTYYRNNESGVMIKSQVSGSYQIEKILRDKKYVPVENPPTKVQRKIQTAKQTVNRKIKNNIGIMVLTDGTYKLLNQLNISYQINTVKNINFIKSFHTLKLIPVYYKHHSPQIKQLYKRAKNYIKCLTKQITPFEINYVKKEEEYFYEQELYCNKDGVQKYLRYLTCKICYLVKMQEFYEIKSGVFVWAVDGESAAVYLGNVHQVKYTVEKNPNEMLDKYMNLKREGIEKKLRSVGKGRVGKEKQKEKEKINRQGQKQKVDSRVLGFEEFLKQSFRITMNQLAPRIEIQDKQPLDIDEAFKKLNPNINFNLSDITKDNSRFNLEMKKMFVKRPPHKKKLISTDLSLSQRKQDKTERSKDRTIQSMNTLLTSRTARRNRSVKLENVVKVGSFTSRVDSFKIGNPKTRIKTEVSNQKFKI